MFVTRKTKIVSAPAEEVLEVSLPEPDPIPEDVIVYNIDFITIADEDEESSTGFLIDAIGNRYEFNWDKKIKRISYLSGKKVDSLIWSLCETILIKYYVKQPKEEPIENKIADALKAALAPINNTIKALEGKIEKTATRPVAPAPAPVQSAPRPQQVQSVPSMPADTPAVSVADDDISANALRFLQQSPSDDLGVDYLSL